MLLLPPCLTVCRSTGTFTGTFGSGKNSLPPNGKRFESGPEAISVSFNRNGQCTKLTVGVLMDPELGNTGGLGGVFGVLFAVGTPLPPFVTRPVPQVRAYPIPDPGLGGC